ncbi:MAG: arsenite methyltransferase [Anaerolineaceae bacterium]
MIDANNTHKNVQKHYAELALAGTSCCAPQNTFYPPKMISKLPADIAGFSLGSGDPISLADLQPGEVVLDLGSGGGLDCFLAARQVGENGYVIGVDMTPEMLSRARNNAERLGLSNVEFRQGLLEALPVENESIDVVISNCVVNLSPDKVQVLREIFRVLKSGGRLAISDIISNHPVSEEQRMDAKNWCSCSTGALPASEYTEELLNAGFVEIKLAADFQVLEQTLTNDQVQFVNGKPQEAVLQAMKDWEQGEKTLFVPHLISARKPARA